MRKRKVHLLCAAAFSLVIVPNLADARSRELYYQRIKPWLDKIQSEEAKPVELKLAEDVGAKTSYQAPLPWIKEQNEARGLPAGYTPSFLKENTTQVAAAPLPPSPSAPAAPQPVALVKASEPESPLSQPVMVELALRPRDPVIKEDEPMDVYQAAPVPVVHSTANPTPLILRKQGEPEPAVEANAAPSAPVEVQLNLPAPKPSSAFVYATGIGPVRSHPHVDVADQHLAEEMLFVDADSEDETEDFMQTADNKVGSGELGDIRGGFMTSNGMMINVGLETRTLVDGVLAEHTNVKNLEDIKQSDMQRLVQVNNAATNSRKLNLSDVPNIMTIVQNSRNDVKIDSFAILNVDVSNAANFTLQTQAPLLFDFQTISNLR